MREFFITTSKTGSWILHIKILRTAYVSATSILDKEARAAFIWSLMWFQGDLRYQQLYTLSRSLAFCEKHCFDIRTILLRVSRNTKLWTDSFQEPIVCESTCSQDPPETWVQQVGIHLVLPLGSGACATWQCTQRPWKDSNYCRCGECEFVIRARIVMMYTPNPTFRYLTAIRSPWPGQ